MRPSDSQPRATRATLAAGLFTNGVWDMLSILVPLHGAAVGLSAAQIGLIVSARSVLPTALSIHGGILMDQWGTRRMLSWLAVGCALLPLVYPATSWFAALVVLQLVIGLAASLAMAAAQTWSLQTSHGDTATLARFSLFSRVGTFLAPVMVGAIWDLLGMWAAFACVTFWAAGIIVSTAYAAGSDPDFHRRPGARAKPRLMTALVPQWSAHRKALALAAIPAAAFVLAVSFLRNAPGAVQSSLYVVYLGNAGLSGTVIGVLVGICELSGVFGSLMAAPLERVMRPQRLVIVCIALSVLAITLTPLIAGVFILLAGAAALRGLVQGLSQPLMYSLLGRAVPVTAHGASVGLRNAVTRLASIVTPAAMGIAAELWSIEASFYAVGAALLTGTACLAFASRARDKR